MNHESELLAIKAKIDEETKKESEDKIKLDMYLSTLQTKFDCESLEDAKKHLKDIQTGRKLLQKQLENGILKLKTELGLS